MYQDYDKIDAAILLTDKSIKSNSILDYRIV